MYNTLKAFIHIIDNPMTTVNPVKITSNRINNVGDALEYFVKDAYSGILQKSLNEIEKDKIYSEVFSWCGNQSNPPDALLRGGDGIEMKKIEKLNSAIALNSSYPKNKLYSTDPRVASGARNAESWVVRDIVYAIGTVTNQELKRLWFIYGDCYAASKETYERLIKLMSEGLRELPDIEFQVTNEIAKIKKVDPLGITDMRVRGMWHIQNPSKLYASLVSNSLNRQYYLLMREDKYQSFPERERIILENISKVGYANNIIEIRNPDNPAQLIKTRFIKYEV